MSGLTRMRYAGAKRHSAEGARDPAPGRHLLMASTGGHLAELERWSNAIGSDADSLWVTCESLQGESLLQGRRLLLVPYVAPRDVARSALAFKRMMREIDWQTEAFTAAVTTGAAVGVVGLGAARLHRVPSFYFESVSRVNGPSLSGRLAGLDPGITRFCQYEHWANGRWQYRRSLFDTFVNIPKPPVEAPSLFVTLGTIQPYRFDSVVDAVLATGLADSRTVWQLGATTRSDLPGTAVSHLSASEFDQSCRDAGVVVTHAGVGTLMNLFDMGISPVVAPRRAARNEHVDDHQSQIAGLLRRQRISTVTEVEQLNADMVLAASATAVQQRAINATAAAISA